MNGCDTGTYRTVGIASTCKIRKFACHCWLLEMKERIMVQTQPYWQALTGDRLVKHPAESHAVDGHCLHSEADDSAGKLVHHDQNPMGFELDGLNLEQVQAPQAVLGLPKECEPGWTTAIADGSIMRRQDPPNHVLVELDPKGFGQLLRDSRTAKWWVGSAELIRAIVELKQRNTDDIPAINFGQLVGFRFNAVDYRTQPFRRFYRSAIVPGRVTNLASQRDPAWRKQTLATGFDWNPTKPGAYTFFVQSIDRDLNHSEH
jgi:hypothetical protein